MAHHYGHHPGAAHVWRGLHLAAIVSLLMTLPVALAQAASTTTDPNTPQQDLSGERQPRPVNITLSPFDPALGWTFSYGSYGSVTKGVWSVADPNAPLPAEPAVGIFDAFHYAALKDSLTDTIYIQGQSSSDTTWEADGLSVPPGKFTTSTGRYSSLTQGDDTSGASPFGYITGFQIPLAPVLQAKDLEGSRTTVQLAVDGTTVDSFFTRKSLDMTNATPSWEIVEGIDSSPSYKHVKMDAGATLVFTAPEGASFMKIRGTVGPMGAPFAIRASTVNFTDMTMEGTTERPWAAEAVLYFTALDPNRAYYFNISSLYSDAADSNDRYVGLHAADFWFVDPKPVDPNTQPSSSPSSSKPVSTGVIVGAVVGGTVGAALIVLLIFFCVRYRQKQRAEKNDNDETRMSNWSESATGASTHGHSRQITASDSQYTEARRTNSVPYTSTESRGTDSRQYMSGESDFVSNPDFVPYVAGDHFGAASIRSLPITDPTSESARDSGHSNDRLIPRSMDQKPPQAPQAGSSNQAAAAAAAGGAAVPVVRNVTRSKRRVVQQEADAGKLEEFVLPNFTRGYTMAPSSSNPNSAPGTPGSNGGPADGEFFGVPADAPAMPVTDAIHFPAAEAHSNNMLPADPYDYKAGEEICFPAAGASGAAHDSIDFSSPRDWAPEIDFDRPLSRER